MAYDKKDLIEELIDLEPDYSESVSDDIKECLESIDFKQLKINTTDNNVRWVVDNLKLNDYFSDETKETINKVANLLLEEIFLDDDIEEMKAFFSAGSGQIQSKNILSVKFTIELGTKLVRIQKRIQNLGKPWEKFVEENFKLKLRTVNVAMLLARAHIDEKYYYLTAGVLECFASYARNEKNAKINEFIEKFIISETNASTDEDEIKEFAKKYCKFRTFYNKLLKKVVVDENLVKASAYGNAILDDKVIEDVEKIFNQNGNCDEYFRQLTANRIRPKDISKFIEEDNASIAQVDDNEDVGPEESIAECQDLQDCQEYSDVNQDETDQNDSTDTKLSFSSSISSIIGTLISKCEKITSEELASDKIAERQIKDGIDALNKLSDYWYPTNTQNEDEDDSE
ncbi:MAG: hypothetical protein AAGU21_08645 [Solidesulfovibrio sp.]|uniref:hypothetical protein n=1 Tax=Solidesulfovibrio sp. TaxID=2910990 RepID=UPI0031595BD1